MPAMTERLRTLALVSPFLALLVGVTSCSREKNQDSSAAAVIDLPTLVLPEPSFDFGQVAEGAKLTHVFKIKNAGAGTLIIDKVSTSCGCTAAVSKNKEVPPGGEGEIEVTFDTNNRSGDNRKNIGIASNDPISAAQLEIHANVEVLLGFEPGFLDLRSEPGKEQVAETWLRGKLKGQTHLKILEKPAEPAVTVKIEEKAVDGSVIQGLRFAMTSKKSGTGSGTVSLETGLAKPDKLYVGYSWTVAGNIEVNPPQLSFSNVKGDPVDQVLRVTSRNADFKLRQARIVSGPFEARIEEPGSGVEYQVHVSLKKGLALPSTVSKDVGKLELVTNDSLEPKKDVSLRIVPSFSPSPSPSEHTGAARGVVPPPPMRLPPGQARIMPPSAPSKRP